MTNRMEIVTINDDSVDLAAALNLMDAEICEKLHFDGEFNTEQDFANAYCVAHSVKFSEEFIVS